MIAHSIILKKRVPQSGISRI